jgi:hypothetical protein
MFVNVAVLEETQSHERRVAVVPSFTLEAAFELVSRAQRADW